MKQLLLIAILCVSLTICFQPQKHLVLGHDQVAHGLDQVDVVPVPAVKPTTRDTVKLDPKDLKLSPEQQRAKCPNHVANKEPDFEPVNPTKCQDLSCEEIEQAIQEQVDRMAKECVSDTKEAGFLETNGNSLADQNCDNAKDVLAFCQKQSHQKCGGCEKPSIYWKTTKLPSPRPKTMENYKDALKGQPQNGYCERRDLTNMISLNNGGVCGGSTENIVYLNEVNFSLAKDEKIRFQTLVDFGYGGYTVMDGEVTSHVTKDIWGNSDLSQTFQLNKGDHKLQLFGSEHCCDGKRTWKFQVNDGKLQDVKLSNLEKLCDNFRPEKTTFFPNTENCNAENNLLVEGGMKQDNKKLEANMVKIFAIPMKQGEIYKYDVTESPEHIQVMVGWNDCPTRRNHVRQSKSHTMSYTAPASGTLYAALYSRKDTEYALDYSCDGVEGVSCQYNWKW